MRGALRAWKSSLPSCTERSGLGMFDPRVSARQRWLVCGHAGGSRGRARRRQWQPGRPWAWRRQQRGCCAPSGRGVETLLTPSVLPKLSNRFMDTLLTPADGADNRTDGPVKAKENGASTSILGALRSASVLSRTCRREEISGQSVSAAFFTSHVGCNTRGASVTLFSMNEHQLSARQDSALRDAPRPRATGAALRP